MASLLEWEEDRLLVERRIAEFKSEIMTDCPGFATERRKEYALNYLPAPVRTEEQELNLLTKRLIALRSSLIRGRMEAGKMILASSGEDLKFLQIFFADDPEADEIRRIERKLLWLTRPKRSCVSASDIELARQCPIRRVIGIATGKSIRCPKHQDLHPSFHLYELNGHCFSCGFHADSIRWLMEVEHKTFNEAVRICCSETSPISRKDT